MHLVKRLLVGEPRSAGSPWLHPGRKSPAGIPPPLPAEVVGDVCRLPAETAAQAGRQTLSNSSNALIR